MDNLKRKVMPDGTIYAGVSPDTGRPMFVTPADAPLLMNWVHATDYVTRLDAHGHNDWRLSTRNELKVIYNNRAEIGEVANGMYWSSTEINGPLAWCQNFGDGSETGRNKRYTFSVRCVRGCSGDPQPR